MKKPLPLLAITACLASLTPALGVQVAYYDFESGSGSVVDLEPVNAGDNSGTLTGNAAYSATVPGNTPSPSNFSLALDGAGDYVDLANQGTMLRNASGFTLAAFVNVTQFPASAAFDSVIFVSNGTAVGQARGAIQIGSGGQIAVGGRRADANGFSRYASATGLVTAGTWSHIAATVDFSSGAAIVSLYHNGTLVSNSVLTGGFSAGTATSDTDSLDALIGAQGGGGGEYVQGFLDDARIYNHALSASEIAALVIPEPGSATLLAVAGLALLRRRR